MASLPSLETLPEELIEIICADLDIESKAAMALLQLIPSFADKYLRAYREYRVKLSNELTTELQDPDLDPEDRREFAYDYPHIVGLRKRNKMAMLIKLLNLRPVRGPLASAQYQGLYNIFYIDHDPLPEAEDNEFEVILYDDEGVKGNYWSRRLGRLIYFVNHSYRKINEEEHDQEDVDAASNGFINDLAEAMKTRINLRITATTTPGLIKRICDEALCDNVPAVIKQEHIRGWRVLQPEELYRGQQPSYSTVYWCKTPGVERIVWVHSTIPLDDLTDDDFKDISIFRMITILRKVDRGWSVRTWGEELGMTIFQLLLNEIAQAEDQNDQPQFVLACGFENTALI